MIAEFLEEYRWESPVIRFGLLAEEPAGTGDEQPAGGLYGVCCGCGRCRWPRASTVLRTRPCPTRPNRVACGVRSGLYINVEK